MHSSASRTALTRLVVLMALQCLLWASGCLSPDFSKSCTSDGDCYKGERCIEGTCSTGGGGSSNEPDADDPSGDTRTPRDVGDADPTGDTRSDAADGEAPEGRIEFINPASGAAPIASTQQRMELPPVEVRVVTDDPDVSVEFVASGPDYDHQLDATETRPEIWTAEWPLEEQPTPTGESMTVELTAIATSMSGELTESISLEFEAHCGDGVVNLDSEQCDAPSKEYCCGAGEMTCEGACTWKSKTSRGGFVAEVTDSQNVPDPEIRPNSVAVSDDGSTVYLAGAYLGEFSMEVASDKTSKPTGFVAKFEKLNPSDTAWEFKWMRRVSPDSGMESGVHVTHLDIAPSGDLFILGGFTGAEAKLETKVGLDPTVNGGSGDDAQVPDVFFGQYSPDGKVKAAESLAQDFYPRGIVTVDSKNFVFAASGMQLRLLRESVKNGTPMEPAPYHIARWGFTSGWNAEWEIEDADGERHLLNDIAVQSTGSQKRVVAVGEYEQNVQFNNGAGNNNNNQLDTAADSEGFILGFDYRNGDFLGASKFGGTTGRTAPTELAIADDGTIWTGSITETDSNESHDLCQGLDPTADNQEVLLARIQTDSSSSTPEFSFHDSLCFKGAGETSIQGLQTTASGGVRALMKMEDDLKLPGLNKTVSVDNPNAFAPDLVYVGYDKNGVGLFDHHFHSRGSEGRYISDKTGESLALDARGVPHVFTTFTHAFDFGDLTATTLPEDQNCTQDCQYRRQGIFFSFYP